MKFILKTVIITVIMLTLLAGGGYWFIQNLSADKGDEISSVAKEIEQQEESQETVGTAKAKKSEATKKPVHVGMSEAQVQIYLHQMTHQKIVADKKRGAVEMTAKNIANMLTIVKKNHDSYEHSDFYEKTLAAWEKGDFSNVASIHNTIWNWHNGTVGRATGLMTQEQEEAYVSKHFR